jgi:carbon storage regulator
MLVLSRKVGERLWIGDNIAITVVRIAQGVVRLGIEAPEETAIVREELRQQQPDQVEDGDAARPPR